MPIQNSPHQLMFSGKDTDEWDLVRTAVQIGDIPLPFYLSLCLEPSKVKALNKVKDLILKQQKAQ